MHEKLIVMYIKLRLLYEYNMQKYASQMYIQKALTNYIDLC